MIRYWFQFDLNNYPNPPVGIKLGCGITANSKEDAIALLKNVVFTDNELPIISQLIENVDISKLDENHVIPNINSPFKRGVWFPIGYDNKVMLQSW